MDWIHSWPLQFSAGSPFWVGFHSRQVKWDQVASAHLLIEDARTSAGESTACGVDDVANEEAVPQPSLDIESHGPIHSPPRLAARAEGRPLVNGSFPVAQTPVPITYVTTANGAQTLLVHARNSANVTHTLTSLVFNNANVTASLDPRERVIPPNTTVMWTIALGAALPRGSVYTLVATYDGGAVPAAVAAGRTLIEFFPMETWQKSSECPFPTVNDTNYAFHRSHGLDTFFITHTSASECGGPSGEVITSTLAPEYDFWSLADSGMNFGAITNTSRIAGIFIGDEPDQNIDDNLRQNMITTNQFWTSMPEQGTYVGGSRNRFQGTWANVVDFKGLDFYIAACAPHVTDWGAAFAIRGSYDYVRTTRDNHMPWPSWLYSQGLFDGWDADILGLIVYRQPDPGELSIEVMSVVAAGAKGFTLFQSEIALLPHYPDSWERLGYLAREIGALREEYRQGDITGMADNHGDSNSIVELVRSPRALILVVININNNGGYSDLLCAIGSNEHWAQLPHTANVTVTVPAGFGSIVDSFELVNATLVNVTTSVHVTGNQVLLPAIDLGSDVPTVTRTIVFSNDPTLRSEVAAGLNPTFVL